MTALTLGQRKDNLPAEVTRFIGRRRELPAIAEAVERHRLVTLRGTGGVGKTRLALRAAGDVRGHLRRRLLAGPAVPAATPRAARRAPWPRRSACPARRRATPPQVLAAALAERELLLILDTCEHLAEACAELAALLLGAAPGLRILATSRAPLGAAGRARAADHPARAAAGRPQRRPRRTRSPCSSTGRRRPCPTSRSPRENTAAVAELCRRLDGIPLALELAAVRLRGMPVEEILARLTDRFRLLGATRTATDRHRTLRAAVSWSYELCTPAEQRLWAELSVFPGGFGLDGGRARLRARRDLRRRCIRLAEKSVVLSCPQAGDGRPGAEPLPAARHHARVRRRAPGRRRRTRRAAGRGTATTTWPGRAGGRRQPERRADRLAAPARRPRRPTCGSRSTSRSPRRASAPPACG